MKCTLIMRDNLEELNARGLADIPVLLGGAALTRTYVERDLREVYDGRLFYGKDAFEGLRVMDRLGEIKRDRRRTTPTAAACRPSRRAARRDDRRAERRPRRRCPAARPTSRPTTRCSCRRSSARKVVKGIALDDIAALHQRDRAVPQPVAVPAREGRRARPTRVQGRASARSCASSSPRPRPTDMLVPQVVYGYFAANGDGNDLVIWKDETRTAEWMRFSLPRQTQGARTSASPTSSGPIDVGRGRLRRLPHRHDGRRGVASATAELFAADQYQDYLLLHGLGVEMAEALAELWHRRIREEWGFADEDGPTLAGLFRQQYRGGRYSWGYPACPDLEDNAKVAELLGADRIGIEVSEETGFQYQPEQTTSAIICHHPKAKYFVAR